MNVIVNVLRKIYVYLKEQVVKGGKKIMGLFSFRATFTEVEGDFEGKWVEIIKKDKAPEVGITTACLELLICPKKLGIPLLKQKETYLLPKDLKGGVVAVDFKDRVTKTEGVSAGKLLFKGLGKVLQSSSKSHYIKTGKGDPSSWSSMANIDVGVARVAKEVIVSFQLKDKSIFSGVLDKNKAEKLETEFNVLDYSNFEKVNKRAVANLEKLQDQIRDNFDKYMGKDRDAANKKLKEVKNSIAYLIKERERIKKLAKK